MPNSAQEKMLRRLKNISTNELKTYSRIYGFTLTDSECDKIIHYLRNISLDPFRADHRKVIFQDLTDLTNKQTAVRAQELFDQMIKLYQIDHLF